MVLFQYVSSVNPWWWLNTMKHILLKSNQDEIIFKNLWYQTTPDHRTLSRRHVCKSNKSMVVGQLMFVLFHFISFLLLWSQLWPSVGSEIFPVSHPSTRNALFRHMRRNGGVNDCVPKAVPAVQLPPSERFRESRHLSTNGPSRWWFQSCSNVLSLFSPVWRRFQCWQ